MNLVIIIPLTLTGETIKADKLRMRPRCHRGMKVCQSRPHQKNDLIPTRSANLRNSSRSFKTNVHQHTL